MKNYSIFFFSYIFILIVSQYIFVDYFNIYHVDHDHYLKEVLKYKEIYSFFELFVNSLLFKLLFAKFINIGVV